jgi:hypothetical protein
MLKESACITRPHRLKRLAHRLYERLAAMRPGPSLSHYSPKCLDEEFSGVHIDTPHSCVRKRQKGYSTSP